MNTMKKLQKFLKESELSTTTDRQYHIDHKRNDTQFWDGYLTAIEDIEDYIASILQDDIEDKEDLEEIYQEDNDEDDTDNN